jgi:arylsulfatase A-like enzyme
MAALLGLMLPQGGQQGAAFGPLKAFGEPAPRRPNVLLVVSDDLGVDHLGWHPVGVLAGNPAPTPVMASLAAQGVVFTEAYAAPICGPSRACLLTGRLPFRHGLGDNPIAGEAELPFSEWTLAEALQAHGYATGGFGKWHVSLERDDPNLQGFDHFDGTIAGLKNASYYLWPRVVDGVGFNESGYNTSVVTDSAIDWIQGQGAGPWFAYVAYSAPHKPMERPPPALNPVTQAKATSTELELYHGTIESLDTELGETYEHLL